MLDTEFSDGDTEVSALSLTSEMSFFKKTLMLKFKCDENCKLNDCH